MWSSFLKAGLSPLWSVFAQKSKFTHKPLETESTPLQPLHIAALRGFDHQMKSCSLMAWPSYRLQSSSASRQPSTLSQTLIPSLLVSHCWCFPAKWHQKQSSLHNATWWSLTGFRMWSDSSSHHSFELLKRGKKALFKQLLASLKVFWLWFKCINFLLLATLVNCSVTQHNSTNASNKMIWLLKHIWTNPSYPDAIKASHPVHWITSHYSGEAWLCVFLSETMVCCKGWAVTQREREFPFLPLGKCMRLVWQLDGWGALHTLVAE